MKRPPPQGVRAGWAIGSALVALASLPATATHVPVVLRDRSGNPIDLAGTTPYSPRATCSPCHDYAHITQAYHFQQGRTNASGAVQISDSFNPEKPWILSDGMYGRW